MLVPVLFVWAVVQTIRKKNARKWWKAFGCAVLLLCALICLEEYVLPNTFSGQDDEKRIVGEWVAVTSESEGTEVNFRENDLMANAYRNGRFKIKSYDSTLDLELHWSYDEKKSEDVKKNLGASACRYGLYYGEVDEDVKMFEALVNGDTLYLQSTKLFKEQGTMEFFFRRAD